MEEREKSRYFIEATAAVLERTIKRLWILLLVLVILLFTSNGAWLWYISQYDFENYSESYTQDGDGLNIIGDRNGVIFDGADTEADR